MILFSLQSIAIIKGLNLAQNNLYNLYKQKETCISQVSFRILLLSVLFIRRAATAPGLPKVALRELRNLPIPVHPQSGDHKTTPNTSSGG